MFVSYGNNDNSYWVLKISNFKTLFSDYDKDMIYLIKNNSIYPYHYYINEDVKKKI